MPSFRYRAMDRAGKVVEGTLVAKSVEELREKLGTHQQFLVGVLDEKASALPYSAPVGAPGYVVPDVRRSGWARSASVGHQGLGQT